MTSKRPLTRPQAARASRARRRATRQTLGRLRDRVLKPCTVKRYRLHVAQFFTWLRRTGREIPAAAMDFDCQLCCFSEALWQEGDSRGVLGNTLSGLAHFVPGLRGKLSGAWRLYAAWVKSEPSCRAPPLTVGMAQAISGALLQLGYARAAWCTLLCFHCLLRTGEMMELRTTDCDLLPQGVMLRLRDTKIGS